jgi:N-acylneuraminate cytidylyltransferase
MEMKCLAIIPARGGSKRIPRKNILLLEEKPLIVYSIEHARKSKLVSRIIVTTDDDEIADISIKHGVEVIKRPIKIADDTATSEDALIHTLNYLEEKEEYRPDIVVFLQCTSPLRNDDDIDNAIKMFLEQKADSLFSAVRFDKYIWRVMNNVVSPINYDYNKRWREQDFPPQYQENGSIYILKPELLKKHKNRLSGKIVIYEMDDMTFIQIDSHKDIELFKYISKKFKKRGD